MTFGEETEVPELVVLNLSPPHFPLGARRWGAAGGPLQSDVTAGVGLRVGDTLWWLRA